MKTVRTWHRRRRAQRGVALIFALILLTVMSLICGFFVSSIAGTTRHLRHRYRATVARNLAEAGIDKAIHELCRPESGYSGEQRTRLGEGLFSVAVSGAGETRTIRATGCVGSRSPIQRTIEAVVVLDQAEDGTLRAKMTQWVQSD